MVVSMDVSVPQAAQIMGVSVARARRLAADGRLHARLVGGRWLIDAASLPSAPRRSRPMSPRMAWALVALSDGGRPDWVGPRESYRLRRALNRLAADDEPELLLRSWLAARAERRRLSASDVQALRADARVILAGVSDERAGLSAAGDVEGYVQVGDADVVIRDHLLIEAESSADVVLHVSPRLPEAPVPLLLVAADLADHDGPRELARAREFIGDWSAARGGEGT